MSPFVAGVGFVLLTTDTLSFVLVDIVNKCLSESVKKEVLPMNLVTEFWKPIEGFPYAISSLGRVMRTGSGPGATIGRILKSRSRKGYAYVALGKNGEAHERRVHSLVAEAFIGPRPKGWECNHIDTDTRNNQASNLEWLTPIENIRHAFRLGKYGNREGERNPNSKLTVNQVKAIRGSSESGQILADRFGVSMHSIKSIRSNKSWKNM